MRRAVTAALVLGLLAGACTSDDGPTALVVAEGTVERRTSEGWEAITSVARGDRIRTAEGGVLRDGEDEVWLSAATELVVEGDRLQLARGGVTVDGLRVAVALGDTTVEGIGTFRIDAGVSPRVGVYAGTAEVRRPGEEHVLKAFRQVRLTSRRFDGLDDPLAYDAADPADRRYLAPAIAFDEEVARYAAGLEEQYGSALQPLAFYATFTSLEPGEAEALALAAPAVDEAGAVGPPSEALIGLFVARALTAAGEVDLPTAAAQVSALRREGARWGLVAMALRLEQVVFAAAVDQAVEERAEAVAATSPGTTASGGTAGPPAPAAAQPAPAAPGAPPPPGPGPAPRPPPAPAAPPPPPPPPGDAEEPAVPAPVQEVVEDAIQTAPTPGLLEDS